MTSIFLPDATERTQVLLLHVPYPGKLKFVGFPSSLLQAIAPFAHLLVERGELDVLGVLDPGTASQDYRVRFRELIASRSLRVLCISTSTAAVEEAAWAVAVARELRGEELLVVVGGPHEDDTPEKSGSRIPGVDLSMAGEAEEVLAAVLERYLAAELAPEDFLRDLDAEVDRMQKGGLRGGLVTLASHWWGTERRLDLPKLLPADLPSPVWTTKRVAFSVFDAPETLPVMLTRGCPYGRCTFCAEPNRGGVLVRQTFDWLTELCEHRPGAALYFQDSIFPAGAHVAGSLLPRLKALGRPWGCQLFLPTLTRPFLQRLAEHGCRYIYTGLETASSDILGAVGKPGLNATLAIERLQWARDLGLTVGISLMFGALAPDGRVLETDRTVAATVRLAEQVTATGVAVAGFYPNIMTVLPGTALSRGLAQAGIALDFCRQPRSEILQDFEDGGVGYNFTTIPEIAQATATGKLAKCIVEAARQVQGLGRHAW